MTPSVVLSRPSPCNVPPKGTLRSPSSLRPCWDVILSILRGCSSVVSQDRIIDVLIRQHDFPAVLEMEKKRRGYATNGVSCDSL